ncbi:hypothetical protein ACR777_08625 [Sphingobacterium spiritivorum]|uniref:hypothetical protein n=1 Tax=Sphingobacterium spiritivorum TaxID=258 RepID=UPI003DA62541
MTAKEFVKNINEAQLSFEFLKSQFGESFANDFLEEGRITQEKQEFIEYNNEILNLILNYDLSKFRVINISFDDDLFRDKQEIFFGWEVNGDRLGFNIDTKEVFAYYIHTEKISGYCAPNDMIFLDVLFELHKLNNQRMSLDDDEKISMLDKEFMHKMTRFFVDQKYVGFYSVVIGYEDDDEV